MDLTQRNDCGKRKAPAEVSYYRDFEVLAAYIPSSAIPTIFQPAFRWWNMRSDLSSVLSASQWHPEVSGAISQNLLLSIGPVRVVILPKALACFVLNRSRTHLLDPGHLLFEDNPLFDKIVKTDNARCGRRNRPIYTRSISDPQRRPRQGSYPQRD